MRRNHINPPASRDPPFTDGTKCNGRRVRGAPLCLVIFMAGDVLDNPLSQVFYFAPPPDARLSHSARAEC